MGLLETFEKLQMPLWHANRSVWGTEQIEETDFLQGPDGAGWHIDRPNFEIFLRNAAQQRGAQMLAPACVETIIRERDGFRVILWTDSGPAVIETRFLIDAGGRSSPVGRSLGARRQTDSALLCTGVYGRIRQSHEAAGITFIEAVQNGWWYTAPLPARRRVLAFHTDASNAAASRVRTHGGLLAELQQAAELSRLMNEVGFEADNWHFVCPASGSTLAPCAGEAWLASGDAALTFDPLSSQGLLNALFLGLAGAEAAHAWLLGKTTAIEEYRSAVFAIREAYCRGLSQSYAQMRRWPDSPFWLRRNGV
jgi:flavin-dependent dehydrogenase